MLAYWSKLKHRCIRRFEDLACMHLEYVLLVLCSIHLSALFLKILNYLLNFGTTQLLFINCAYVSFRMFTKSMQRKERQAAKEGKHIVYNRLFTYILLSLLHSVEYLFILINRINITKRIQNQIVNETSFPVEIK
jgi:small-conductance mechanosensitive channel